MKFFIAAIIVAILPCTICSADEIIDSINESIDYYNNGEYASSAGTLEYATQLIRQKSADALSEYLPAPIDGWSALDATSQTISSALLGGAVFVEKQYNAPYKTATIKIVAHSPMIQSVMMMLTNPLFAAASGVKIERISGQKAVVRYSPVNMNGEINIVAANKFLITVRGSGVQKKDLLDYANLIDYEKMAKVK